MWIAFVSPIRLREGFKNQILYVIPRNLVPRLSEHPLVFPLMPTDIGWYPQARFHYCKRETGAHENILILCLDGDGWYNVGGTRGTLKKNEALLIPRDTPHVYAASESTPWCISSAPTPTFSRAS